MQFADNFFGRPPLSLLLHRAIVVDMAFRAAVEAGAILAVARQATLHRRDEHVAGFGAHLGSGMARFALHFAVRAMRKFGALKPRLSIRISSQDSERRLLG